MEETVRHKNRTKFELSGKQKVAKVGKREREKNKTGSLGKEIKQENLDQSQLGLIR